ncbi:MAG TPA: carbonic anhydrase family protein [Gemmatimonadaceae bacterium]|nr:carbonic anhydrase family protein [Gemmatimonadaceae bacterium]
MRGKRIAVLLLLAGSAAAPKTLRAQWKTPWDYTGPRGADQWSALDPAYAICNTGKQQSPIDIVGAERADLPALSFENHSAPLDHLVNNGHTVRVNYAAPGSGDFLIVGEKRYQLTQFHFHHPAEELINGKRYPMELHYMYAAADGEVAGVAVFLEAGRTEATVQTLWDHMPLVVGKEENIAGLEVNPGEMLPPNTAYYRYLGSVTAPPCTEGVVWYVVKTPVEMSAAQIAAFAKLYPNDARHPMPLNGRVVSESR